MSKPRGTRCPDGSAGRCSCRPVVSTCSTDGKARPPGWFRHAQPTCRRGPRRLSRRRSRRVETRGWTLNSWCGMRGRWFRQAQPTAQLNRRPSSTDGSVVVSTGLIDGGGEPPSVEQAAEPPCRNQGVDAEQLVRDEGPLVSTGSTDGRAQPTWFRQAQPTTQLNRRVSRGFDRLNRRPSSTDGPAQPTGNWEWFRQAHPTQRGNRRK